MDIGGTLHSTLPFIPLDNSAGKLSVQDQDQLSQSQRKK